MNKIPTSFKALIASAIIAALTTGCTIVFNKTEAPPTSSKEALTQVPGKSFLASLEDCEIIIAERVYKQSDFLFVERGSGTNHFVGTTYKGERVLFDLPSDRSVNGTKNMIAHFYQTRDACFNKPPTTSSEYEEDG